MRVAVVAGEASGDLLGSGLLRALAVREPALQAEGIGGPQMQAAGCRSLYPMERLSVTGLVEAVGRYAELLPVRARLFRRWAADPPDVFVGIDAPDFNLGLELKIRQAGIPTVHYVSPSVWAWRRYRIHKIARAVDLMLTLFPFEADFYRQYRVPVRFVGHPLADQVPDEIPRAEARQSLGMPVDGEVVALLPGSRHSELRYLAEPMIGAARWLAERRPGLRFIAPLVNAATREQFEHAVGAAGSGLPIDVHEGGAHLAMAAADVVLVASGTATLEALLLCRPMVIAFRVSPVTFRLAKPLFSVDQVGLPNFLAGRKLVPELIQGAATPERMGSTVLALLEDSAARQALRVEMASIGRSLRMGADQEAADAVLGLVSP